MSPGEVQCVYLLFYFRDSVCDMQKCSVPMEGHIRQEEKMKC